jgi:hypothetical protein
MSITIVTVSRCAYHGRETYRRMILRLFVSTCVLREMDRSCYVLSHSSEAWLCLEKIIQNIDMTNVRHLPLFYELGLSGSTCFI